MAKLTLFNHKLLTKPQTPEDILCHIAENAKNPNKRRGLLFKDLEKLPSEQYVDRLAALCEQNPSAFSKLVDFAAESGFDQLDVIKNTFKWLQLKLESIEQKSPPPTNS